MAIILIFVVFLCLNTLTNSATLTYNVTVDTSNVLREISSPFYGFTFDFWKNKDSGGKWYPSAGILSLDLSNKNLIALTKEIAPAILRIGGSPQDSVVYDINGECSQKYGLPSYGCSQTTNSEYYGCINKTRWDQINQFGLDTNVTLLFGLNACYGRKSSKDSMNFSNIENLINYTNSLGTKSSIYGFEFGNELQSHIDVETYSKDFYKLYQIINNKYKLIGNDDYSSEYTQDFLNDLDNIAKQNNIKLNNILHRLTYHHYPNCGYPNGDSTVFSLSCLETIHAQAETYYNMANKLNVITYMGEGSEHSGGGTPNVSNTFVDNFYYVYQLGNVLTYGVLGTIRSDLTGGDYELIDHLTFLPNPDYWILYIWKQLIGSALFQSNLDPVTNVRIFTFKGKSSNSIVLAVINFDLKNSAQINIKIDGSSSTYNSDEYYLKPDGTSLQSRKIYVNDVLMEYNNGEFPTLQSVKGNGKSITLNPARIAFVVLTPQ